MVPQFRSYPIAYSLYSPLVTKKEKQQTATYKRKKALTEGTRERVSLFLLRSPFQVGDCLLELGYALAEPAQKLVVVVELLHGALRAVGLGRVAVLLVHLCDELRQR